MSKDWTPYRPNKNFDNVPFNELETEIWNNGGPWAGIDLYMKGRRKKHRIKWITYTVISIIVLLFGISVGFFNLGFWQDFISNGLATLLGAAAGIPIALSIDRRLQKKENYERKKELLEAIILSLIENINQIEQIIKTDSDDLSINIYIDTTVLETTMLLRYDVIENYNTNFDFDKLRLLSEKIQRRIDTHNQFAIISSGIDIMKIKILKTSIFSDLSKLLEETRKVLESAKGEYYHTVESIRMSDPEDSNQVGNPIE